MVQCLGACPTFPTLGIVTRLCWTSTLRLAEGSHQLRHQIRHAAESEAHGANMKLPNADHLRVDCEKIAEYLLSLTHPDGHSKAEFFTRFGFFLEHW